MAGAASTGARPALGRFVEELRVVLAGAADAGGAAKPRTDVVSAVEDRLRAALADGNFVLECLGAALLGPRPVRGLVHREPDDLFTINVFYWAPGVASPPHEHRNWTVTGVVLNTIDVRTFTARADALVEERVFTGRPGQVGAVRPPCIHSVRNPSPDNSVTVHVFSRSTVLPDTTWYTGDDVHEGSRLPQGPAPDRPMLLRIEATVEAAERVGGPPAVAFLRRLLPRMGPQGRPAVLAALARLGAPADPGGTDSPGPVPGADVRRYHPRVGRRPRGAEAQAIVARAQAFDMREVVTRYQKDHGVDDETAALHEAELKRYLTLAALYPDAPLGMSGRVDELWHTFIIFTQAYQRFCHEVAGYFIHHRPTDEEEVARSAQARAASVRSAQRFVSLYDTVFGTPPRPDVWGYPSSIVWKCQKCGNWPICNNSPPDRCQECVDCSPCDNRPPDNPNCVNCQTPSNCDVPVCESPVCESPICESPVCETIPDDPDDPEEPDGPGEPEPSDGFR